MAQVSYYDAWQTTGLQTPQRPPEMRPYNQHFVLHRQEEYLLDCKVKTVAMGLGWDTGCDVDGSAALFDAGRNVVDTVWWKHLVSTNGAVRHSGDDRTGEGGGDDEVIVVDIERLPLKVHYMLFAVCIYSGAANFTQVRSAYVRMVSGNPSHKNQELARYRLTGMQGNAMLLGLMSRRGAYWNFTALGTPAHGSTILDIIKDPATSAIVSRSPSQAPGIRKITLRVVKGRNLVAKDRGGVFSRKNASSDPFVKIKFKKAKLQSDVISKSLNPVWNMKPFELGNIMESESKSVKLTIWDYDKLSGKDFMGAVWLPGAGLYAAGPGHHEWWIPLTQGKQGRHQKSKVTGDIFVQCTVKDVAISAQPSSQYDIPAHVLNPGPPASMPPQGSGWPPQQQSMPGGYPYPPTAQPGGQQGYPGYHIQPQGAPPTYYGAPGGPGQPTVPVYPGNQGAPLSQESLGWSNPPGGPQAQTGPPPGPPTGYPGAQ